MNLQFAVSVAMGCTWLVAGVYLLIAYPDLPAPLWLLFGLLFVWNVARAYVTWKPARPRDEADDAGS